MSATDLDTLPPEAAELAGRLQAGELLGATRQLVTIGAVLASIARQDPDGLARVVDYFMATRGQETRAVANGLRLLTTALPQAHAADELERRVHWFESATRTWTDAIATAALAAVPPGGRVVAFDYSSVVAEVLIRGHRDAAWSIVIPESRALEGGRPFVDQLGTQRIAQLVPDVALGHVISGSAAVFIGAESCFADGSCHNTIGSLTAALCAVQLSIPLYVATPLLKFAGVDQPDTASTGSRDFADRFGSLPGVDTVLPENERVPGALITAYLTEQGRIPPDALVAAADDALAGHQSAMSRH